MNPTSSPGPFFRRDIWPWGRGCDEPEHESSLLPQIIRNISHPRSQGFLPSHTDWTPPALSEGKSGLGSRMKYKLLKNPFSVHK